LQAAAAWDGLAAELGSAADSFGSVTVGLAGRAWQGRASASAATVHPVAVAANRSGLTQLASWQRALQRLPSQVSQASGINLGFGNIGSGDFGIGLTGNNQIGFGGLNSGSGNTGMFNPGTLNTGSWNAGTLDTGVGNTANLSGIVSNSGVSNDQSGAFN
jgi:PPE-repeat protein